MVKVAINGFGRIGRPAMLKTKTILIIIVISSLLTAVSALVRGFPLRFLEPVFCIQVVGAVCPPFNILWLPLLVDFGFWTVIATIGFAGLRIILGARSEKAETQPNSENEKKSSQKQSLSEQAIPFKSEPLVVSKNKLLITGIAVTTLLVLATGIASYLVYRNYQFKKQPATLEPVLSPQPTQLSTKPGPTANWKIHRNEEYGFQIYYPDDWIYEEKAEEYPSPSKMKKRILFSPASVFHINPGAFSIQFYEPENKLTLGEFIETFLCHSTPEGDTCSDVFEDDTDFSLKNNVSARKIIYHPRASFSESIFFENNGVFLEFKIDFEMPYHEGVTPNEKREIFNQILSTFKFLDQTQTGETAGWKIYRNEEYGFTFEHPNFDYLCCNISGPLSEKAERVIVLADKSTTLEGTDKPFNGLAVYVEPNTDGKSFQKYMEEQKEAFLENYYYAMGGEVEPNPVESSILVGGQEGIVLKDYAWWADMIYTPFPNSNKILIIAKTEESKGSFDVVFNQILSTFRFID